MTETDRTRLFDQWAADYDRAIASADAGFPFGGYEEILDAVVRLAAVTAPMRVLDLGIGTGNLAERFIRADCAVWGVDFSAEMLAQTRAKWPQVHLVQADLLGDWPAQLPQPPLFDRVVSAYVLHEFDLAAKVRLLRRAAHCCAPGGYIVVADIAFPTAAIRAEAARHWADRWDPDEHYWAADEACAACAQAGLAVTYTQVSSCGGVFTVTAGETSQPPDGR